MIVMMEEGVNHACLQNEQSNVGRTYRKENLCFLVCNITLSHAKIYEYPLLAYVPHEYH